MRRRRPSQLPRARDAVAAQSATLLSLHERPWLARLVAAKVPRRHVRATFQQFSRSQIPPNSLCSFVNSVEGKRKTMITKMSHATVWVNNQQEALEFYRDKLGFEVDTDAMIGDDYRWLTMRIKSQPGF